MYVLVTGPPASGKTTLARELARAVGLPLLAKDTIKTVLVERLGAPDVSASRELGRVAVACLLAVADDAGGGVIDSVWIDREAATVRLSRLPGPVVEVFCRCDLPRLRQRYAVRAPTKGPGHFDRERTHDELWGDHLRRPLAGPWPVIEADTARHVDVESLAAQVRRAGAAASR